MKLTNLFLIAAMFVTTGVAAAGGRASSAPAATPATVTAHADAEHGTIEVPRELTINGADDDACNAMSAGGCKSQCTREAGECRTSCKSAKCANDCGKAERACKNGC